MKKLLIILFLFVILSVDAQITDKQIHFIIGSELGSFGYLVGSYNAKNDLKPITYGIVLTGLIGSGKELLWDKWYRRTKFDVEDLKATIKGGITGIIITEGIVLGWRAISKHRYYHHHYNRSVKFKT